jgi:hypothetical protein
MSKGITSILNTHYNDNQNNFQLNIESDNLKTVMLKIGEKPDDDKITIDEYIKNLQRHKQSKLSKKPKISTKTKRTAIENSGKCTWDEYKKLPSEEKYQILIELGLVSEPTNENWKDETKKLIGQLGNLDKYFENYGKARRFILSQIYKDWCNKNGEYNLTSEELMDTINTNNPQPIQETTFQQVKKLENPNNNDKLDPKLTQEISNAFHNWVSSFVGYNNSRANQNKWNGENDTKSY